MVAGTIHRYHALFINTISLLTDAVAALFADMIFSLPGGGDAIEAHIDCQYVLPLCSATCNTHLLTGTHPAADCNEAYC